MEYDGYPAPPASRHARWNSTGESVWVSPVDSLVSDTDFTESMLSLVGMLSKVHHTAVKLPEKSNVRASVTSSEPSAFAWASIVTLGHVYDLAYACEGMHASMAMAAIATIRNCKMKVRAKRFCEALW